MEELITGLGLFVGVLVIAGLVAGIFALPVMWLLNYVFAPSVLLAVFGVAKIGFWKALGVSTLSALLFKSYNDTKKK